MRSLIALATLVLAVSTPLAHARDINVPVDQPTIQAGIDAAATGDRVIVHPGTYHEYMVDFHGRAITVMSTNPKDSTIVASTVVDADSLGTVFFFHSGEDTTSILSGLTITGGLGGGEYPNYYGGGITMWETSPIVHLCRIVRNSSAYRGGGLYYEGDTSHPRFYKCDVFENTAMYGAGACIEEWRSVRIPILLRDCRIFRNHARGSGGGISAGAMYSHTITLERCLIQGNSAVEDAGGIYIGTDMKIVNSLIVNNQAGERGGGLYGGGGPFVESELLCCTLFGNTADFLGDAVYVNASTIYLYNGVIYGNGERDVVRTATGYFTPSYSDIRGGWQGVGNIDADPIFLDPEHGNFHLAPGSPCIDTGTLENAPAEDFDRDPRPVGEGVDMGADEFTSSRYGSVQGIIRDRSVNAPLKGVRVEFSQNYISAGVTTTDQYGAFGIALLPGTYAVHAQHPGFLQGAKDVTIVADNTTTADLQLDHWDYITHVDVPGMGPGSTGDITIHIRVDQGGDYQLTKPIRRTITCTPGQDNTITFTGVAENRAYLAEVPLQLKSGITTVDSEKLRIPVDLASPLTPAEDAAMAAQYAPVLRLGNEEVYQPKGAIPTLEVSNLTVMDGLLPKLFAGPLNSLLLDTHFFRSGWTDIASPNHQALYNARVYPTPNTVYARIVEENGRLFVFYWLHYFVSNWDEYGGANFHEGDWEGLAVEFTLGQTPVQVGFAQHFRFGDVFRGGDRLDWSTVETDGDHVIGYVSEGSHSTYPHAGVDPIRGFGNDVHEGDGVELLPQDLFVGEDGTEPYTLVILPRLDETWESRAPGMEWVRYMGEWGQKGIPGYSGATAPVMTDRWFTPIDWIDNLDASFGERPMGPPTGELHIIK
ncbi:MAG: carboxypeptidase regulatory-like domain-containing protein [Candidatus Kerfeldbacteria bacterium]|nr:carboxypeptidase regulatory-like domain-containing protein [Candidatus Kerfeldbacteria bacterium]